MQTGKICECGKVIKKKDAGDLTHQSVSLDEPTFPSRSNTSFDPVPVHPPTLSFLLFAAYETEDRENVHFLCAKIALPWSLVQTHKTGTCKMRNWKGKLETRSLKQF